MKNAEKNPTQSKPLIEETSKTIEKMTIGRYLSAVVNYDSRTCDFVRLFKVWNKGEKMLQTDIGDQFIF